MVSQVLGRSPMSPAQARYSDHVREISVPFRKLTDTERARTLFNVRGYARQLQNRPRGKPQDIDAAVTSATEHQGRRLSEKAIQVASRLKTSRRPQDHPHADEDWLVTVCALNCAPNPFLRKLVYDAAIRHWESTTGLPYVP